MYQISNVLTKGRPQYSFYSFLFLTWKKSSSDGSTPGRPGNICRRVDPGLTQGRPRVDPGTKFVNFVGFSKILKEVMILQDPDPQKLLHINTPDKVMKKLTFYHGSCDWQTVICISENISRPGSTRGRPGTRNIFWDTNHGLSIEVRMIKTCFFHGYFQRINLKQSLRVRIPVILYFSLNLSKSVKIINPGDENW